MGYERVMVFVAHPDDEGTMGGTIVKMRDAGTEVTLVQMCTGSGGYPKPKWKDKIVEMRTAEGDAADKVLGIRPRIRLGRPDGELVFDRETSDECIRIIREVKPNAIFTHGEADQHPDHRNLVELVKFAFKMAGRPVRSAQGPPWQASHLYFFGNASPGSALFEIDISAQMDKKIECIATQKSQYEWWGGFENIRDRVLNRPHVEHFKHAGPVVLNDFIKPPEEYERILVFAAHPDDETSMGGTIARFAEKGTRVFVCQMTDGSEGYPKPEMRDKIVEMRRAEAEEADNALGIERRYRLDRPDMALLNDKETFKECIRIIREVKPDAIFTHGGSKAELHRDHKATYELSIEARWQAGNPVSAELGEPWRTPRVYCFGRVDNPDCTIAINVNDHIEKKIAAVRAQISQYTLWGGWENMETRMRAQGPPYVERFVSLDPVVLREFL